MGTPTVACEAEAMHNALLDADVHPSQVSYVETHGTGTVVGDPLEVTALSKVYSEGRTEPLVIGSVKTIVGHTEACSGITGIMKVILSMEHESIPPHRNFKQLNPDIDLDSVPARVPLEAVPWPIIKGKRRTAGVSSFGITGTDGHVILQESGHYSPQRIELDEFERPLHLLKITARTEEALEILLEKYKLSLSKNTAKLADLAYTSNVGKAAFNFRAALVATSTQEAVDLLESGKFLRGEVNSEETNVCFLFTGQGSQYVGMAHQLYQTSPVFRIHFDYCEDFLTKKYQISIADAFWGQSETSVTSQTLYSQTGIFVVEYCLLKLWQSWGVTPTFVVGHSLGEFCAAVCAGILEVDDALTLVAERSCLIDQLPSGKMLVVKADKMSVETLLGKFSTFNKSQLDFAAVNSNDQTVLAGDSQIIQDFADFAESKGIKTVILQSSHAFHSKHMDPMLQPYRKIAKKINYGSPTITYVSGMLGKILGEDDKITAEYWVHHTRNEVNFLAASKAVCNEGCRVFLEIGPHPVLSALTMINNEGKSLLCLPSLRRNEDDWKSMLGSVAKLFVQGGVDMDWRRFDQFYQRSKCGHLLPAYPFQGQKYWPMLVDQSGAQIHPLLGSLISNPTSSKLFQNNLSLQNLEYLRDHVIGDNVVFPGAGYIETLLMAGHATLDGIEQEFRLPRRPVVLQNFRIEAPLGLDEGTGCSCQTVVEYNSSQDAATTSTDNESNMGFSVKLFHELKLGDGESSSKWLPHACGSFLPFTGSTSDLFVSPVKDETLPSALRRVKEEGIVEAETSSKELYDKLLEVGLKFGPAFRTLRKVWRTEHQEFLGEVSIPKDSKSYLVHPTVIDAMIQATVFHAGNSNTLKKAEKKLHVPIGCHQFIWFKPLKSGSLDTDDDPEVCYLYSSTGNSRTVLLLDKVGDLLAALVGVEAIETKARSIKALLETQVKLIPDMYTIQWRPTLGPMQSRLEFTNLEDIVVALDREICDQSSRTDATLEKRKDLDDMAFCYITHAFLSLGWDPKLHDKVVLSEFIVALGIKPQHKQLIRRFLCILDEEGILEHLGEDKDEGDEWRVAQSPMSQEQLVLQAEQIIQKYPEDITNVQDASEIFLLRNVGQKLDKILTGTESALRIIFPDDESKPSAVKFYNCVFKKSKEILYRSWSKIFRNVKTTCQEKSQPLPTIRILEVGAGTGSVSETVIQSIEDAGIQYEYVYTDISAAFFPAAEKRFEKFRKSIKFQKLNIEQDPTSQGYPPNYFDFIIAAQVVHATRDIKETLTNCRQLMRPSGNLCISEIITVQRLYDCIFGLLDGFWRFTDTELRRHHTLLTIDNWIKTGHKVGFSNISYCHSHEIAIIGFRADSDQEMCRWDNLSRTFNPTLRQIHERERQAWVIFYDEKEASYVNKLKKRFHDIGRKTLILVKHSSDEFPPKMTDQAQKEFFATIRPDKEEDMVRLFSFLSTESTSAKHFSGIEGVLVTWGLTGEIYDQTKLTASFLHLVHSALKLAKKSIPQIILLTTGAHPVGDICCPNPAPSTMIGMSRCILNEHSELKIRGIDISPGDLETSVEAVFQEIFSSSSDDSTWFSAFRFDGTRLIPKFLPEKSQSRGSLSLPSGTDRFQLLHPKSKSIQDLEFGDWDTFSLKPLEIEVKIKFSALNFKDILNILKPVEEFQNYNQVGFDYAGVVTSVGSEVTKVQVGDPVCGLNIMNVALPSHIKLPEHAVIPIPDKWTFAEAACFPAVFSTAYYCLVHIAKIQKDEILLIHTASGGVGLVTIQLAKHFGLKIIATAGSNRKRAYLRSLGIQHVFHSRNTNYGKEILKVTNGLGVNIVLNSLTGPGFKEASLGACAAGARFVEMSRLNIWSVEEVQELRPDVQYSIIDLSKMDEKTSLELAHSQSKFCQEILQPIPYTRFDAVNIRDALTYLQKAQHIGKVVVAMPDLKIEKVQGSLRMEQYTPLLNEKSTYLITGGLGGIGLEVCKFMAGQNAKNIVLLGRSPPGEKTLEILDNLMKERNCNIVTMQADIGDWNECLEVFERLKCMPPLRGVMHAAGVLADGMIENQTWPDFQKTFRAKVDGSWNLHKLTKDMVLEHFVFFSSVTAPLGSPGQSNHVSACTFEDTMTHFRNSHGLTATTINWGQFGMVGVAAEAEAMVIRPFSPQQGINALDVILRTNKNFLTVATFQDALFTTLKFLPYTKRIVDEQVLKMYGGSQHSKKGLQLSTTQFWEAYHDSKDDRCAKVEVVKSHTKIVLRHVLRLDVDENIDENMDLQDMGVDSLMLLELKNHLQEVLGDRVIVTQAAMKDCNTVNLLADRLVQIIEEEGEFSAASPPSLQEVREMIQEDCKVPERIQADNPGSEKRPSEITCVLITGATGTLGSHMLRELLESCTQLEKIYCLVRIKNRESGLERLTAVLERQCIMSCMKHFDKVVTCIEGNFIEDKLGLSDADYEQLCGEVDAVIHCGAKVNHVEFYRNVPGGRNDARSVNVGGLLQLLQFAGAIRTKYLFTMSTMLSIDGVNEEGSLKEAWPDLETLTVFTNRGYVMSKQVCDVLLKEVTERRNIPCKSFRFAELRGSVTTGKSLIESSHILRSLLFFMKLGLIPETPVPFNFVPMDMATKITVLLMFNDDAPNDCYNVVHGEPGIVQEYFPGLAEEMGHPVTLVETEEYRKRVVQLVQEQSDDKRGSSGGDTTSLIQGFQDLYTEEDTFSPYTSPVIPSVTKFMEMSKDDFFKSKKLAKYVPELYMGLERSYDILKRDFLTAKKEGIFDKFGL